MSHPPALASRTSHPLSSGWWIMLLLGVFWLSLPWAGLPGAHVCDDVALVPPAIDFAQGRPMSSHVLRASLEVNGINPDRWLCHSPVYAEILGVWLRIFGISNLALLMFQAAVNIGTCGALLAILRRFKIHPGWSLPPAAVLFVSEFRNWGMRWEGLGMLLLLLGVAAIFRRDRLGAFLAGACWIGAGAVVQQAGIYTGLFSLVAMADILFFSRQTPGLRWQRAAAMVAGATIPVVCFLWGIGWDLPEFLRVYKITLNVAAGMAKSRAFILQGYADTAFVGWEWIRFAAMVPLAGVVVLAALAMKNSLQRWLLIVLPVGLAINLGIVEAHQNRLTFIYMLFASAAFCILGNWRGHRPRVRFGLALLCPGISLALSLPNLAGYFCRLPGNAEAVRQAVSQSGGTSVYLDSYAAWDVYHWHLPAEAQSLQDSRGFSPKPVREGEIFIVQESVYKPVPLRLFGRAFRSVSLNDWRWDVVDFQGRSLLSGDLVGLPPGLPR